MVIRDERALAAFIKNDSHYRVSFLQLSTRMEAIGSHGDLPPNAGFPAGRSRNSDQKPPDRPPSAPSTHISHENY
ncbi:hypothetical protein ACNRC9_08030 [Ralstonia pseudosolanacearum]|uniref:hypothetical protein n=1 Tax=Ralstonia pseudosolanacearum TaxID=1310165 RepID=UPI003AAAC6C1